MVVGGGGGGGMILSDGSTGLWRRRWPGQTEKRGLHQHLTVMVHRVSNTDVSAQYKNTLTHRHLMTNLRGNIKGQKRKNVW